MKQKTVVEINCVNYFSTGKIMNQVAELGRAQGFDMITSCPRSRSTQAHVIDHQILFGDRITRNLHLMLAKYTGFHGCFSVIATLRFLHQLDGLHPALIHLHNLHNCYINIPLLFHYIKKKRIPVVWTFHDCWPITGQCPHFERNNCSRWETGCGSCPQYNKYYPLSRVDRTKFMWKLKRKCFTGIEKLVIVTPSHWLKHIVERSFLRGSDIRVIPNGVDLNTFNPRESDFRARHGIGKDQYMLLGVASRWTEQKGIDIWIRLAKELDDRFRVVLVGTDEQMESTLPKNIIAIRRTTDQSGLADIYSAADLFVNPTREECFGLVNIEALACGTPVLTFRTGGSPECVTADTGSVVPCNDYDALVKEIHRICTTAPYRAEACQRRAEEFEVNSQYNKYIDLYTEIIGSSCSACPET